MTELAANLLIRKLERDRSWPPRFDRGSFGAVAKRAALREADEPALRLYHHWPEDRSYVIDPIADRVAEARADLLFSEDPRIAAAKDPDQGNLNRIVEISKLPSELHYAEQLRVSEGEVWGRLRVDPTVLDAPLVTFHSREYVLPLYVGGALIAVAFVDEFEDPKSTDDNDPTVWRHLEIQSLGRIENRLYKGTASNLGQAQDLDTFPETEDLETVWQHGIPEILAERIIFRRGRWRGLGRSIYHGIEPVLLALNEALTIGVENARLVAKQRAVVPAEALNRPSPWAGLPDSIDNGDGTRTPIPRPQFDAGEDLIVTGGLDATLGKEQGAEAFKVLEYSFDATALVAWQDKLVKTIARSCGLTVSFIGEGDSNGEGTAESGTALRVRLLPATSSSRGSARAWDDALPRLLMLAQLLDAMPSSAGGFGRSYSAAGELPSAERGDPIPRDEAEETARHVAAVGGPIESVETAVRETHPDWSPEQITEEVGRIRDDVQTGNRLLGLGAPPFTPQDPPPDPPPGPSAE